MPAAKAKLLKTTASGVKPYSRRDAKGRSARISQSDTCAQSQPYSPPPKPDHFKSPFCNAMRFRQMCEIDIKRLFPFFTPRDDFELLVVATWHGAPNHPTVEELHAFADQERARLYSTDGIEGTNKAVRTTLDHWVDPTGIKPLEGAPFVYTRKIPGSEYSVRLFPGCYSTREWGMDFVRTATGEAVNRPFKFELWAVPNPKGPANQMGGGKLRSFEESFRIPRDKIRPGEEKFLLRDGDTCLLKRPGEKDIRFTVPIRPLPSPPKLEAKQEPNIVELDFPETLSAEP